MRIREGKKHFALYCMLGFFAGILYANFLSGDYIDSMGILNEYFLDQYRAENIHITEYLWYVARLRLIPILALGILSRARIRKEIAALFLMWTGFCAGLLFTSAVMKMGVKGIILCLIAFVPQFGFYIAAYFALLWYLYTYPEVRWNLSKTVVCLLLVTVGILLECYVNPVLMQMFVSTL